MSKSGYPVIMRSMLFVPAHNDKLIASALRTQADVLLFDVEDSVQPINNKQVARDNILKFIGENVCEDFKIFPRVNDRESGQLLKDLYQLTVPEIDGFMYPKSYRGEDIYFVDKLLETIEYEKGIARGHFKIIPLIETTSAVVHINEICSSSPRVVAVAFGCEDYLTDLGSFNDLEGQSIFTARSLIAMAAKANGIIPIDTVHIRVHDMEDLEYNLDIAKKLGFEGMLSLHPKEIKYIHQYFSPTQQEIDDAHQMLRLAKAAEENNQGVAYMEGKFIGPPMVLQARKIIARHEIIKRRKEKQ